MEFTTHHSSSAGNLYSVSENGHLLGIECGVRILVMRAALGFRISQLDGVLVSHYHGDHSKSAWGVMRAGIDVWASQETWDHLDLRGPHQKTLTPKEPAQIGTWTVVPFDLRHDAEGTLGFVITSESGEVLVFITDTAYSPYTFPPADIYAIECNYSQATIRESAVAIEGKKRIMRNHLGLETAIKLLQANDLTRTREIHLLHLSDTHGDSEEFKRAIQAATGKPVYIGQK